MKKHRGSRGYSLSELLTIVMIIGVITAVSIPAFTQLIPQYRIRAESSQLASAIRTTRQKAIAHRAPWRISFDFTEDRYKIQRMAQIPTTAVPMDDPDNWLPTDGRGNALASGDPKWLNLVSGVDLQDGAVNQFHDVDGDDLVEIVFDSDGTVADNPTEGTSGNLTFTSKPEVIVATGSTLVAFNRYAIRADERGSITVVAYKVN